MDYNMHMDTDKDIDIRDAEGFNARLRLAREQAGLKLIDVIFQMRTDLPEPLWISQATLQRYETRVPEHEADPFVVSYLAGLYSVRLSYLSQTMVEYFDAMSEVLKRTLPWITVTSPIAA